MKKTKHKIMFSLIFSIALVGAISYFAINNSNNTKATASSDSFSQESTEQLEEKIVYLGKEQAENEIIFLFDYSCPYCHEWINKVFPKIQDELIKTGKVKFRAQSMVYLNETSLKLSKIDQNIKVYYPKKYFNFFLDIMKSSAYENDDKISKYINNIPEKYALNEDKINQEPAIDVINLTRKYTRDYEIDSVPTVIVNGQVVEDSFNIKEIQSYLNKFVKY